MAAIMTESLLATIGVIPRDITRSDLRDAAKVPAEFSRHARAWWTVERSRFKEPPRIDTAKMFDEVATPIDQLQVKRWLDLADEDDTNMIAGLMDAMEAARSYLVTRWPRITIDTFAGPRPMPLPFDDAAEAASLFAVVDGPRRIREEMDYGSLTPSQAEAFRAVYPSLFDAYRFALADEAAKITAKNSAWMPDEAQTLMLSVLTNTAPGALTYVAEQPAPEPPKQARDFGAKRTETQADKSSKPKYPERRSEP